MMEGFDSFRDIIAMKQYHFDHLLDMFEKIGHMENFDMSMMMNGLPDLEAMMGMMQMEEMPKVNVLRAMMG